MAKPHYFRFLQTLRFVTQKPGVFRLKQTQMLYTNVYEQTYRAL